MPDDTARGVSTVDVVTMPGDNLIAAPAEGLSPGVDVGRSAGRRRVGLAGQYAVLVALASIVLLPVGLTLIQALSPPFTYIDAGKPLHPVAVDWKDRTWFTGGAFSVVARTLVIVVFLGWVQLRAAAGRARDVAILGAPRRALAIVAGTAATALLATPLWGSLFDRASATTAWWIGGMVAVGATQLIGFGERRPLWRVLVIAATVGVGVFTFAVVAFGASVWNRGWDEGDLGPAMGRSFTITALITVAQVVTSILAAYAFAFLRFPAKPLIFAFFVGTMLLPLEVTLLDGYGHLQFLVRFAVPLTRPVIASFVVISALGAWNQYLWPQAVIDDSQYHTAQIKLRSIVGTEVANANVGIAAALIVAVPVLLLLIAFQRQIIRGLTAGAVKG